MKADLLSKVVSASGLSSIFAERTIARALRRAGVDPANLSSAELKRSLPELEKMLATFLDPPSVAQRMSTIRRLAD